MYDLRCGVTAQSIKYNEESGNLKGICGGYYNCAEHRSAYPYHGPELYGAEYTEENPFSGEIVTTPEAIQLIEQDGKVMLTNACLHNDSYEYIKHLFQSASTHSDMERERRSAKETLKQPETQDIIAIWNNYCFELVSLTENGSKILRTLYKEMKIKNVAISTRNGSMVGGGSGLSFVIVSELTEEDYAKKKEIEQYYVKNFGISHRPSPKTTVRPPYGHYQYRNEQPTSGDKSYMVSRESLDNIAKGQRRGKIAEWFSKIYTAIRNGLESRKNDITREQGD